MSTVAIIIVTYNSLKLLQRYLPAAAAAAEAIGASIIVVDNQSRDGTPDWLRAHYPRIHLIANPDNLGFAAANNIGLAQAQGDYLLLLNPDVLISASAILALLKALETRPDVGICGPRTYDADGGVAVSAYGPLTPLTILWQYWGLNRIFPYAVTARFRRRCETAVEPFEVAWVQGHCLLLRRAVYEQIGGLDDRLFLFAEEPDYCERAAQAGWKTLFVPAAEVVHDESSTISNYSYVKMLHLHISMLYYFRKRRRRGAVWALKVGFTIELAVKWGIRRIQWLRRNRDVTAKLSAYPRVIQAIWRY
ncbi:MAG: glycosyltransferase family 2 protein [Candidatus Flexifilum sp.]|jgi:GT2 family glycosyltransferase